MVVIITQVKNFSLDAFCFDEVAELQSKVYTARRMT